MSEDEKISRIEQQIAENKSVGELLKEENLHPCRQKEHPSHADNGNRLQGEVIMPEEPDDDGENPDDEEKIEKFDFPYRLQGIMAPPPRTSKLIEKIVKLFMGKHLKNQRKKHRDDK